MTTSVVEADAPPVPQPEHHDQRAQGVRLLLRLAASERSRLVAAVTLATLAVLCQLIPYVLAFLIVRELIGREPFDTGQLLTYAALAFAGVVGKTALMGAALHVSHAAAYNLLYRLRVRIAERLARLPLGSVTRRSSGEIGKIAIDDVERMELFLAHLVPEGTSTVMVVVATTVWLVAVDWRMGLAAFLVVPLAVGGMVVAMRGSVRRMVDWHTTGVAMDQSIVELIHGIKVVKVFNRQADQFARASDAVRRYAKLEADWGIAFLPGGTLFTAMIAANVALVLPVGLGLYATGRLALDTLLLFLLVSLGYTSPLVKLSALFAVFNQIALGAKATAELLDEPELPDTTRPVTLEAPSVEFRDVSFGYDDRQVLDGVSFVARAGEVTALVGPSGAGKTTIARLAARFWDVRSGAVLVGGADVREQPVSQLMQTVAFVFQDAFLFRDTIRNNLLLAKPDATDTELEAVTRAARCHDVISGLPDGYDTVVGERGATLSGGERQRIAIARALLADAPVVILDEATASTDPENEAAIQEAIGALTTGRTLLVIAHRLQTIRDADQILVVEDGRIAERGRHDELVEHGGRYARMWSDAVATSSWTVTERRTAVRKEATR